MIRDFMAADDRPYALIPEENIKDVFRYRRKVTDGSSYMPSPEKGTADPPLRRHVWPEIMQLEDDEDKNQVTLPDPIEYMALDLVNKPMGSMQKELFAALQANESCMHRLREENDALRAQSRAASLAGSPAENRYKSFQEKPSSDGVETRSHSSLSSSDFSDSDEEGPVKVSRTVSVIAKSVKWFSRRRFPFFYLPLGIVLLAVLAHVEFVRPQDPSFKVISSAGSLEYLSTLNQLHAAHARLQHEGRLRQQRYHYEQTIFHLQQQTAVLDEEIRVATRTAEHSLNYLAT